MKYNEYLKNISHCPFCFFNEDEILKKNKHAKVVLSKAPYREDHLLVVSNIHVTKMKELNKKELKAIFELVCWTQKKLNKYHENLSILYREGNKKKIGKSIDHFHINLIPNEQIGSVSINSIDREILSDEEYIKKTKLAKGKFK